MSETVFILGAGASADAGAPTMSAFLDRAEDIRAGLDGTIKSDFDSLFGALKSLEVVHTKSRLDTNNIEEVLGAFEMGRLIGRLPGFDTDRIEGLLTSARRVITTTLEESIQYQVSAQRMIDPAPVYARFVQFMQDAGKDAAGSRYAIITFNWDTCLDFAMHSSRCSYDYCLSGRPKVGYIPLLKLHGSLNWARCSQCGQVLPWEFDNYLSKFPQVPNLRLGSWLSRSGLTHCGQPVDSVPSIVPPTWNKTEHQQGLLPIWKQAAEELSEAQNIVIVGFSMTPGDSFVRYLIALGCAGGARLRRFWVLDPDPGVEKRYREIIGETVMDRFRFWRGTFHQELENMIREVFVHPEERDWVCNLLSAAEIRRSGRAPHVV